MDIKVIASGSSGNAYLVSDGSTTLLLDAGIPLKEIQIGSNFRLNEVSAALITHEHKDHSKAARDLATRGVDVYASAGTLKACNLVGHRFHAVTAHRAFDVGTFRILPFDVQHDVVEPLGFLCVSRNGEKLLYFTDTYYIKYRFKGLTHIMAECNYSEEGIRRSVEAGHIPIELVSRLVKSHMSLDTLLDMLRANDLSKVRQIYLLHLSENNSEAERFRDEVAKTTGAEVYVC